MFYIFDKETQRYFSQFLYVRSITVYSYSIMYIPFIDNNQLISIDIDKYLSFKDIKPQINYERYNCF